MAKSPGSPSSARRKALTLAVSKLRRKQNAGWQSGQAVRSHSEKRVSPSLQTLPTGPASGGPGSRWLQESMVVGKRGAFQTDFTTRLAPSADHRIKSRWNGAFAMELKRVSRSTLVPDRRHPARQIFQRFKACCAHPAPPASPQSHQVPHCRGRCRLGGGSC